MGGNGGPPQIANQLGSPRLPMNNYQPASQMMGSGGFGSGMSMRTPLGNNVLGGSNSFANQVVNNDHVKGHFGGALVGGPLGALWGGEMGQGAAQNFAQNPSDLFNPTKNPLFPEAQAQGVLGGSIQKKLGFIPSDPGNYFTGTKYDANKRNAEHAQADRTSNTQGNQALAQGQQGGMRGGLGQHMGNVAHNQTAANWASMFQQQDQQQQQALMQGIMSLFAFL